ncbi:DUF2971 domain-containing protein [Nitrosomonas ureae]|uniref:DUF2971 family protein n=1 Tax=Nitrosomonas ureae TaxID=44577 RepID=A0A1H9FF96_9PROT|nr:DUF2971 domain-containing protein [Nitrosomonas ureae]SEQ36525.1 Protein of unknown function [Nitrosomonas ureae]
MSHKIYRFISFESFVDIVLKKHLTFVTFDMWQDPYEGFVIKAMKTEQGKLDILQWLSKNHTSNGLPSDVQLHLLDTYSKTMHLQSWTYLSESDALWRIYSHHEKAIRIKTDTKKIEKLNNIAFFRVDYQDMNLNRELKSIFTKDGKMHLHKAFAWKRDVFEHEKEIRLFTHIDNNYLPKEQYPQETIDAFLEGAKNSKDKDEITEADYQNFVRNLNSPPETEVDFRIKKIPFSHVPEFIESVMVHPNAADWYIQTVKDFCENYQINFVGKSSLYTFSHKHNQVG